MRARIDQRAISAARRAKRRHFSDAAFFRAELWPTFQLLPRLARPPKARRALIRLLRIGA
jgi:hypothetical protein